MERKDDSSLTKRELKANIDVSTSRRIPRFWWMDGIKHGQPSLLLINVDFN